MLRRIVGIILIAVVLIIAALFVVRNYSAVPRNFACTGTLTKDGTAIDANFAVRITEYRWWVGLWSSSDGSADLEMPGFSVLNFWNMDSDSIAWSFYRDKRLEVPFGLLSKTSLTANIGTSLGVLDGECSEVEGV